MKEKNELSYRDLKMICNQNMFDFETTKELEPINDGIGQERGIKALEFGINVNVKGYNLYIEGPSGVGKTMYAKNYLESIAPKKKVPNDWCYIYNFKNPNEPIAVSLTAGQGKEFKESMEGFIKEVKKDIKKTFNADDFEKEKALIKKEFEEKREIVLTKLNENSQKHGFQVKSAQNGIYMMPVIDGKVIPEEEFEKLEENIRQVYEEKSVIVQQQIMDAISEIKQIERQSDKKVSEWQSNIALLTVNAHINYIKSKYKRNKKINQFLNDVKQDVLKNVSYFLDEEKDKNQTNTQQPIQQQRVQDPCLNYRVNLFIDNSGEEGCPVVMDSNYAYQNLFGKLEYENYYGSLKTDFTMLKPGLMHKANGGYIIFQAKDLLANPLCYEELKRVLRIKELAIDNTLEQVVGEAGTWAKLSKSKIVTEEYVDKALNERIDRIKKYDEKYIEMITDNTLLINTKGSRVGEINGLTVMTIGDYTFGKPAKITVNTYTGKGGIVNIEREVEMSGSTHSKGVYILSGYLGELFAQDIPLCLTASICFEQLYNGVDGDSASSTELYGLLSSLSEIPIKQSIAVTGSVNQKGQIQPIGGVNEKIEGFFQICKMRGLDGSHGVMIPVQNINNLQLSDEVVDAVKNKEFHIYAVSTIEEGIEVLTGVPAGKKDKEGNFPAGTINRLVYEKLKKYAKICER